MKGVKVNDLVLIEWVDSRNYRLGWNIREEEFELTHIHTVGFVRVITDDLVVITHSISTGTGWDAFAIPICSIIDHTVINIIQKEDDASEEQDKGK